MSISAKEGITIALVTNVRTFFVGKSTSYHAPNLKKDLTPRDCVCRVISSTPSWIIVVQDIQDLGMFEFPHDSSHNEGKKN